MPSSGCFSVINIVSLFNDDRWYFICIYFSNYLIILYTKWQCIMSLYDFSTPPTRTKSATRRKIIGFHYILVLSRTCTTISGVLKKFSTNAGFINTIIHQLHFVLDKQDVNLLVHILNTHLRKKKITSLKFITFINRILQFLWPLKDLINKIRPKHKNYQRFRMTSKTTHILYR